SDVASDDFRNHHREDCATVRPAESDDVSGSGRAQGDLSYSFPRQPAIGGRGWGAVHSVRNQPGHSAGYFQQVGVASAAYRLLHQSTVEFAFGSVEPD